MNTKASIVLALTTTFTTAQVPFLGDCPRLQPIDDLNMTKYLGKWYEAERYFQFYQMGGKCVSLDYIGDNDTVKVISRQKNIVTGSLSKMEVKMNNLRNAPSPVMFFKYPFWPIELPYNILETDYDNYSVAWACNSLSLFSVRNAWIFTRERHPPLEIMEMAYSVLDRNGLTRAFLFRTDQRSCPDDDQYIDSAVKKVKYPQTQIIY